MTRKTALITGSGRNIGKACALRLASDGFNVVLNGSGGKDACEAVAEACRAKGTDALVVMADVGTREGCEALADAALGEFGRIDVLLNNAAVRPPDKFLDMTEEQWFRVLDVGLTASFRLSRAFLPGMVAGGWGRIVNFAGMNAIHGYNGRAHVSASKHGSWGLTKALAKEFAPHGVTANIISPGPIKPEEAEEHMRKHIEETAQKVPSGRMGEPAEVAAMVGLLCAPGGGYVNGQLLQVNGGAET